MSDCTFASAGVRSALGAGVLTSLHLGAEVARQVWRRAARHDSCTLLCELVNVRLSQAEPQRMPNLVLLSLLLLSKVTASSSHSSCSPGYNYQNDPKGPPRSGLRFACLSGWHKRQRWWKLCELSSWTNFESWFCFLYRVS